MKPFRSERVEFEGSQGHRLSARLELPLGRVCGTAVFAHCFTCGKDIAAATRIARGLAREGLAVLRFDFTGLGHSDGEFANTDFSSNVEDLVRAADWLRGEHTAPVLFVGHSLGGAAVLSAAHRVPELRAIATIGAPADPEHVRHLFGDATSKILEQGEASVTLAGRPFKVRRDFLEDLEEQDQRERIRDLGRPLLVMHAPDDEIVGIDNAASIYRRARHPKSFVSLDGADHLLTRKEDADWVAGLLAAWVRRYLPKLEDAKDEPEGEVLVRSLPHAEWYLDGRIAGRFLQEIAAGEHELLADEPKSVGGDDRGPTPYDLLLAGLGACTSMTLGMYARRKKWALDRVTVELAHERIHAEDCAECEATEGRVERIVRRLEVEGDLDDEQRARLLEIADRCPVHRTLEGKPTIVTRFADSD